jgi:hypothetical protein
MMPEDRPTPDLQQATGRLLALLRARRWREEVFAECMALRARLGRELTLAGSIVVMGDGPVQ